MKIDVLLSAMWLEDYRYIGRLHITGNCVVINQCDREREQRLTANGREICYVETRERGLSKSRNMALEYSDADICILCDNDVQYVEGYEDIIARSFAKHAEADVIVFFVKGEAKPRPYYRSEQYLNYVTVLKVGSPEIAFRRRSLENFHFHELFGAGSVFSSGEENLLLYECLKRGLKILYLPLHIADLFPSESTWFQGYTEKLFRDKGACYAAMAGKCAGLLRWQFLLRKHKQYKDCVSLWRAAACMREGQRLYRRCRIFLVGDFTSGTGPARVTEALLRHLPKDTLYLKHRKKLLRALEIFIKTRLAGITLCSGFSAQNLFAVKYGKRHGNRTFYLMHGCVEYENEINGREGERQSAQERELLERTDRIIAVSGKFQDWLEERYPFLQGKICSVLNGLPRELVEVDGERRTERKCQILSVGGGAPEKNMLPLCRAVEQWNTRTGESVKLVIVGAAGEDTESIKRFPCVDYRGLVPYKELLDIMQESRIFVQNSRMETFCLAAVEALMNGCDCLLSQYVGVLSELKCDPEDVIEDVDSVDEIEEKLGSLLRGRSNNERLREQICGRTWSAGHRARELEGILWKEILFSKEVS